MSTITIYKHFDPKSPKFERNINHILNRIKTGASKELVYKIRATKDPELKKELPAILFSGTFSYRNDKSIISHSGFICLDFDKFPDSETLLTWKDSLQDDIYTYSVFISPSGNGLKVIVKIPPIPENHKGYFEALKQYYNSDFFDVSSCNISRICFESYDPYLIINQNSVVWDKCIKVEYTPQKINLDEIDEDKSAKILLKWWMKKYGLYEGNRNSNVFKLCAAFNDYGVSRDNALAICSTFQHSGFTHNEIETIVKSAYKKTEKFGTLKF